MPGLSRPCDRLASITGVSFRRRQVITAALTANALQPPRMFHTGVPSFVLGWLTSELAPQLLGATLADAAVHTARGRRDPVALALAAGSAVGLAWLVRGSRAVQHQVEDALVEGLGVDYVEELDTPPTPAELAVTWRSVARPFAFRDPAVKVHRNVAYADQGRRGRLNILRPAETGSVEPAPVLLQVHGGGWSIGDKDRQGMPLMTHMARKGWVCVAINYRLAPRHPFPAQIIDVKRALAWIKENIADHGGDPDHVVITGGSAGGHLAALAALTPNDPAYQPGFEEVDTSVAAAVPVYGVYDFAGASGLRSVKQMRDVFLAPTVFRKPFRQHRELFEAASPLLRITEDAPDFFVLHGTRDTLVGVDQARMFVERLRAVSRHSVVYAELPGAHHAFDIFHSFRSAHVVRAIDRYLSWHWDRVRRGRPVEVS